MISINIFGGPGTGKSTLASGLFYHLRTNGYHNVELLPEPAKDFVFNGELNKISQRTLFEIQAKRMSSMEKSGVPIVICDSPLLLNKVYSTWDVDEGLARDEFHIEVEAEHACYENYNLVLERVHRYQTIGRVQNLTDAEIVHNSIVSMLNTSGHHFQRIKSTLTPKTTFTRHLQSILPK